MEEIKLLEKQLTRMRGMNRFYHHQFLIDVRIFFVLTLLLFYLSFDNYFSHYLINLSSILIIGFFTLPYIFGPANERYFLPILPIVFLFTCLVYKKTGEKITPLGSGK